MPYICKYGAPDNPCNCCIAVNGNEPPDHPCARGHMKWERVWDESECEGWMGDILPGQDRC